MLLLLILLHDYYNATINNVTISTCIATTPITRTTLAYFILFFLWCAKLGVQGRACSKMATAANFPPTSGKT